MRAKLNLEPGALRNCLDQLFRELGVTTRVDLVFFACSEEGKILLAEEAA